MIYHLTSAVEWKLAQQQGYYVTPSLDREGFIHCSTLVQAIPVANAFYQDIDELVMLCIDETLLDAEVKWEAPAHLEGHTPPADSDAQLFPHVYGVINLEAVMDCVSVPADEDGYHLPAGM
ncbi:MAG: DUF952 domain-containing protein [Anaerolineae bacterium]